MKKLLATVIVMMLVVATFVPIATATAVPYGLELSSEEASYTPMTFSDVDQSYWAYQYISELTARRIMTGYPDGKFRPERIVTRAEFAALLAKGFSLPVQRVNYSSFSDLKASDWASPWAEATKEFLNCYYQGKYVMFKPNSVITREEVAKALVKAKGYDIRLADCSVTEAMFVDYDGISQASQPYVALAVENGLMSGYSDDTFRAQAYLTRSQLAALIWRASAYGSDNQLDGTTTPTNPVVYPTVVPPSITATTNTTTEPAATTTTDTETIAKITYSPSSITCDNNGNFYYVSVEDNYANIYKVAGNKQSTFKTGDTDCNLLTDTNVVISSAGLKWYAVKFNPANGYLYALAYNNNYSIVYVLDLNGKVVDSGYTLEEGNVSHNPTSWFAFNGNEMLVHNANVNNGTLALINGDDIQAIDNTGKGWVCGLVSNQLYYAINKSGLYQVTDNLLNCNLVKAVSGINVATANNSVFYYANRNQKAIIALQVDGTQSVFYSYSKDTKISYINALCFDNSGKLIVANNNTLVRIN